MKALVILPGLCKYLPYVSLYKEIFQNTGTEYKILQWDRVGEEVTLDSTVFKDSYSFSNSLFKRGIAYVHFIRWVKTELKNYKPDFFVVATIAPSICLVSTLLKYRENYIIDIRDYSPLVKLCKPLLTVAIRNSKATVISSKGFLRWLPDLEYVPVYNVGLSATPISSQIKNNVIRVSTIGFHRDYEANRWMIDALGNLDGYELYFHGEGIVLKELVDYVKTRDYSNVYFTGNYEKVTENQLYAESDIINILMPSNEGGKTLLSNRFINAISNYKPVIVIDDSYQAELVREYKLGLIINSRDDLKDRIAKYLCSLNQEEFVISCNNFINKIRKDHKDAIDQISEFFY